MAQISSGTSSLQTRLRVISGFQVQTMQCIINTTPH